MCGRFSITAKQEMIQGRFNATFESPLLPNYNAAPSQDLPAILNTEPDIIKQLPWGLHPAWLKRKDGLINVRAETIRDKKTFHKEIRERRCLIPADGFYEWKKTDDGKVPYRITLPNDELFAFAGIWREHEGKIGFAIITTEPNEFIKPIHKRMPVILDKNEEDEWLNPDTDEQLAKDMLDSYADKMKAYVVSKRVNSPGNNDMSVIKSLSRQ